MGSTGSVGLNLQRDHSRYTAWDDHTGVIVKASGASSKLHVVKTTCTLELETRNLKFQRETGFRNVEATVADSFSSLPGQMQGADKSIGGLQPPRDLHAGYLQARYNASNRLHLCS